MNEPGKGIFKDHFSGSAALYAAHRPRYPAALTEFLASAAPGRELAWDCGCGSGQLSTDLAGHFARVIATDASAEQIARAVAHPGVEYRRERAEASGLPDACADLVVAAQAAHWFDLPAWAREVRRVGKPGAVVAAAGYGNVILEADLEPLVVRFYSETLGPYWPPERALIDDDYRSLHFPFEEIEAPRLELSTRWVLDELLGYVRSWSAVTAIERVRGAEPFEAFRADLARAWGPPETRRDVRWPMPLRVGRVTTGSGASP